MLALELIRELHLGWSLVFDSRAGIINSSLQIKLSEVKQLVHSYSAGEKGLEFR